MSLTKRSYTTGHFELQIDHKATSAYLKSVEGGFAKTSLISEPIGHTNEQIKHSGPCEIDPLQIEFGLSGADDMLKWIQASWRKKHQRNSGQITHADFNLMPTFEHEFMDCLIVETSFPALDGAAKEAGYIKCKIQPERIATRPVPPSNKKLKTDFGKKQKLWLPANFRFNIDGIDEMRYTNKLDAITVKQGVKKTYVSDDRFPTIEPTKIEFPNITGTIALTYSTKLFQWYEETVMKGKKDSKAQKTGSIEFLTPTLNKTIFSINLYEMGLVSLNIEKATANNESIKRVKFELYCGRMEIDGRLGFD